MAMAVGRGIGGERGGGVRGRALGMCLGVKGGWREGVAKLTHFLVLKMDHFLLFLCPRLGFLCFRSLRCLFATKMDRRKRVREEKQKK